MNYNNIKKPIIFISHASSDGEFASAMKQEIEKVFANEISVFCTSSPGSIPPGTDWLSLIEKALETSKAVIAIVTPTSIERHWLWFEIGAIWYKSRSGETKIYPLCVPEVNLSELPSPLDRLQALSIVKDTDLTLLFKNLINQFGFGQISHLKISNITKQIPKYENVKIKDEDLNERSLYSGKYSNYTDEELIEVIDTNLFQPDHIKSQTQIYPPLDKEDLINRGKLIHFMQVDKHLELPPGTAKRLLNSVALRYDLEPLKNTENIVRYHQVKNKARKG